MLGASLLLFLVPGWQLGSRFVLNSAKPEIYNIDVTEQHPKTVETALKHCETYQTYADKSKCASHTLAAFQTATTFVNEFYQNQPVNDRKFVILDSGCGAGMSTVCLAKLHPDIPIIGIDRSIARLSRNKKLTIKDPSAVLTQDENGVVDVDVDVDVDVQQNANGATSCTDSESVISSGRPKPVDNVSMLEMLENEDTSEQDESDENSETETEAETSVQLMSNAILLRAELSDFFTLVAYESDWMVHSHYLLYPNPYPKGKHLKRRWHGHPIFPVMLSIGGTFTVRSNWRIYCEEMESAVGSISASNLLPGLGTGTKFRVFPEIDGVKSESVTTHFERKYIEVGLKVFEFSADLGLRSKEERRAMLDGMK